MIRLYSDESLWGTQGTRSLIYRYDVLHQSFSTLDNFPIGWGFTQISDSRAAIISGNLILWAFHVLGR